jgi:GntR family transcriptional regulator/MocR family aminotransferase
VERRLAGLLELGPMDAGMHTVGWLPPGTDDRQVSDELLAAGVDTVPMSRYWMSAGAASGLMLGYAAYTPPEIRDAVERMARVLERDSAAGRTQPTARAPSACPASSAPRTTPSPHPNRR